MSGIRHRKSTKIPQKRGQINVNKPTDGVTLKPMKQPKIAKSVIFRRLGLLGVRYGSPCFWRMQRPEKGRFHEEDR